MNWYKTSMANLRERETQVGRSLNAIMYLNPKVDLKSLDFGALMDIVKSTNTIPHDISPERFTAMLQVFLNNHNSWEDA